MITISPFPISISPFTILFPRFCVVPPSSHLSIVAAHSRDSPTEVSRYHDPRMLPTFFNVHSFRSLAAFIPIVSTFLALLYHHGITFVPLKVIRYPLEMRFSRLTENLLVGSGFGMLIGSRISVWNFYRLRGCIFHSFSLSFVTLRLRGCIEHLRFKLEYTWSVHCCRLFVPYLHSLRDV